MRVFVGLGGALIVLQYSSCELVTVNCCMDIPFFLIKLISCFLERQKRTVMAVGVTILETDLNLRA